MKIKKGDTVLIRSGKDRKKTGKVIEVFPKDQRIMVEGINIVKKHVKPKRSGEKGQRVEVSRPIYVSSVKLICSKCKNSTRIGFRVVENKKYRICKKCGQEID
ncbi:MAG: 50S ribosomal protein L24 [Candidatus Portnoybacteria bacterium RBG_13_40_8]|uniref:Large ribosomal subunit protein uL24 n=1 Tax=Candidatus Portnoybacteria bacterium RBG_13_40_8 TaxID=1801990 RepID=A0A1G2F5T0_9BACT|nr:MAG: 50S ribosomal protein L24 [Candidatus Portnoybacteria bacterium RBG_13_40_8]OGZ35569.1 MAG: 50S ribosomal protein L24 [Candidatus Portnoybacteria bacterium RIFCSPHIGHO2_01_FULL_39_19]